ncbi:MAG: metallophosphoesterase [Pseudomonadota bacterium]
MPPPRPDGLLYAIGDVHGCADLLRNALAWIAEDMAEIGDAATIVLLGDYIDRGERSAEVLEIVRALSERPSVVALKGNHEAMMEAFLADPAGQGPRWIRGGGAQTLANFGISNLTKTDPPAQFSAAAEALRAALPDGLEAWLETRPAWWRSGNLICAHAGLDPALPPEAQTDAVALWGHPAFLRRPRQDGCWVAHGHFIVDTATARDGRIALDTGAYATGRLAVGAFGPDAVRLREITLAGRDWDRALPGGTSGVG